MGKISFVIPCYNSELSLGKVVSEIVDFVGPRYSYEIVLVNDCSTDNVSEVITALCNNNENIKGIELAKNSGQHNAIFAGYQYVTGEFVVGFDDDGELSIEDLPLFIDKMNEGYDVVMGNFSNRDTTVFRNLGSAANDFMANKLIGKPKDLEFSSYYMAKRFVVDAIKDTPNPNPYLAGSLITATSKTASVPIRHSRRLYGSSGYTFSKLLSLWLNGFTAFSVKPLRVASFIGAITALIGFIFSIVVVLKKLFNPSIAAGYSSVMAVMLFIGGVIMLILGMIGEYVGRIYLTTIKYPQYVIKKTDNIDFSEV